MATAGYVLRKALSRILVQAADAPLEPNEYVNALDDLNNMMSTLEGDGISLGYTQVDNVADLMTVPDAALLPISSALAVLVAPDYAAPISPSLAAEAVKGRNTLRRLSRPKVNTSLPDTLPYGSGNESDYGYDNHFYTTAATALLSMAGNTDVTTITTADTPVRVYAFWKRVRATLMRGDSFGRITSEAGADVSITVNLSLTATGNGAYTFRLMKNGVSVASDTVTLSATAVTSTIAKSMTLSPADYIEAWVEADGHTENLTVVAAQFEVK